MNINSFNAIQNDIKQTWCIISGIINAKNRKVENIVTKIIHDDVVHKDSEDIANLFNNYFVDIGKSIDESVGSGTNNHLHYMADVNQPNSFYSSSLRAPAISIHFLLKF